jgi:polysaccharide pyruvyl transferase WcaK-like protein
MAFEQNRYIIAGYYGANSFGDELILHCILRKYGNQCIVISKDPLKSERLHKIKSISKKSIVNIVEELIKSEGILIGGGGLFLPSNTKSYIYYSFLACLAKFLGKKVLIERVGIQENSLKKRLNRLLMLLLIKLSDKFSVRDKISLKELESNLNIKNKKVSLEKDFVVDCLNNKNIPIKKWCKNRTKEQVGLSLMYSKNVDYDKIAKLLLKYKNFEKRFYVFNMSDKDFEFIKTFVQKYNINQYSVFNFGQINYKSFEDLLNITIEELLKNRLFISMRLHPLILAHNIGVPSIAIAHNSKIKAYCQEENINVIE